MRFETRTLRDYSFLPPSLVEDQIMVISEGGRFLASAEKTATETSIYYNSEEALEALHSLGHEATSGGETCWEDDICWRIGQGGERID